MQMNEDKATFVDPKTGEEMKSTALARWASGALWGFCWLAFPACLAGLGHEPWLRAVSLGLLLVFLVGLCRVLDRTSAERLHARAPWTREVHDAIARWQHRRRKRTAEVS